MTEPLPEWDHDDPLDTWRPTPAEDARALELWQMCIVDDPRFGEAFNGFIADVLTEKNLPSALVSILRAGRDIVANCDQRLVNARLSADVSCARRAAIEEVEES